MTDFRGVPAFACGRRATAVALAALAVMHQARADSLSGTRTDGLREGVPRIALRFERDHAQLTVQRSVFNSAAISDQATWLIDLPQGAVATGLRTRSAGPGPLRWFYRGAAGGR